MPNYVWNILTPCGSEKHKSDFFDAMSYKGEAFDYNSIVKMPEAIVKAGLSRDREDRKKRTQWMEIHWEQAFPIFMTERVGSSILWQCAWTPPEKLLRYLSKQWPQLDFVYEFTEEGGFFPPSRVEIRNGTWKVLSGEDIAFVETKIKRAFNLDFDIKSFSVVLSIKPRFAKAILEGRKTVEFRKVVPNLISPYQSKIYLYASSPIKKIVGRVTVKNCLRRYDKETIWEMYQDQGGISHDEFMKYCNRDTVGVIELVNPICFPKPLELWDLGVRHAPQSFVYVETIGK